MIPKLKKKLGVLKFLGQKMTMQQRKKMADGVIMSRILYEITVWENLLSRTQLERVQTVQTLTLRWIIREQCRKDDGCYLNSKELLEKPG